MEKVSLSQLGKTHQYAQVNPGEKKKIFEFKIPSGYVGFIYKVAHSWYPDTYLLFRVDGELVEKIEYAREISNPIKYDPPIVVKYSIEVWAVNNSSESHYFEFWIDGVAIEIQEVKPL